MSKPKVSVVGSTQERIEDIFKKLLDGMEARPRMYCSTHESYEETYLIVLGLCYDFVGADTVGAREPNVAWQIICRKQGCRNGSLAEKLEREGEAIPDPWATLVYWTSLVRDLSFPAWKKDK